MTIIGDADDGGGEDAALPVDPLDLVKSFGIVGEVLVVNDDAAAGVDSAESDKMMDRLLDSLPCRLSGGFTTNARVYDWLDKGASHVVVEYAASNLGFLDGVPKERITIAVTVTGSAGEELQIAGGGAGTLQAAMDEIRYYGTRLLVSFDGAMDRSAVEMAKALTDTAKGLMLNVQDPMSADEERICWVLCPHSVGTSCATERARMSPPEANSRSKTASRQNPSRSSAPRAAPHPQPSSSARAANARFRGQTMRVAGDWFRASRTRLARDARMRAGSCQVGVTWPRRPPAERSKLKHN